MSVNMKVSIVILLLLPEIIYGYVHSLSGEKYLVKVDVENGTCLFRKYENVTSGQTEVPWLAKVLYRPTYNKTGWDYLEVETNPDTDDMSQAYGAGYCEGVLTCKSIKYHWTNVLNNFCENQTEFCNKVQHYLSGNLEWITQMIRLHDDTPFWHQVKLFYRQMDGIYYGQKRCKNQSLSISDILWMNMLTEIEEMKDAFNFSTTSSKLKGSGRCSAIVKLLPDLSDLYVAHNTWTGYQWMLRQVKKYKLNYHISNNLSDIIPGNTMVFSGYPGTLPSIDDFYIINTGLVVLETTIGNENKTLWNDYDNPVNKVSTLARSIISNRLARYGYDWANYYANFNNGLYNNQWMIVDMNRFLPGIYPKIGTLVVVEQIPTLIKISERTNILIKQGYWPSYNIPSSPEVFNLSGNVELVKKFGDWFSYENSPRAKIFKRDQTNVKSMGTLMSLMRYNDYKYDPLSRCNCTPPYSAENAIASRCDLNPDNGTYPIPALSHRSHGAIDVKITSKFFTQNLQMMIVCGPSSGTRLPVFNWSRSDFKDSVSHIGQPDVFNFSSIITDWLLK
uniref:Phospholipase B-like n=1 Tax=Clastoptera arizonana TaxID=38151 RepID=A0A1B6E6W8_9HEMI